MSLRMGFAIMQRGDRMTNELAIRILTGDVLGTASQTSEAIKMAVKALSLPSAQPEMVKCKKCRYVYYDEEFGNYWCNRMSDSFKVEADGYCKWGE